MQLYDNSPPCGDVIWCDVKWIIFLLQHDLKCVITLTLLLGFQIVAMSSLLMNDMSHICNVI